jgi:hypothetical protein
MPLPKPARYVLIAAVAFIAGIVVNCIGGATQSSSQFDPVQLMALTAEYGMLHVVASAAIVIVARVLPPSRNAATYLLLSAGLLVGSTFLFNPTTYGGGIHLFVIFTASLFLIGLDNWLRSRRKSAVGTF